jgi:hypothetical protein
VMAGRRCSRQSDKREAGKGSSSHDLRAMVFRMSATSASETGRKQRRGEPVKGGSGGQGIEGVLSSFLRMDSTFEEKKEAKAEGRSD